VILYTPLDIPKIEPNNWDEWWEIWNNYSAPATKKIATHNPHNSNWESLEIYRHAESSSTIDAIVYESPRAPDAPVIRDLVQQIKNSIPAFIYYIRVIENKSFVLFHTDNESPMKQFRSLLWSTNNKLNWVLRKNGSSVNYRPKLPDDSNTFFYYDNLTEHCAVYDPRVSKGLIQLFISDSPDLDGLITQSSQKYSEFAWSVEIDK
jgi:hypothetical protein